MPSFICSGLNFINAKWRGLYFLHCLMFCLGLLIHFWSPKSHIVTLFKKNKKIVTLSFWFLILTVIAGMAYIRNIANNNYTGDTIINWVFLIVPIFPVALICIFSFIFEIKDRFFVFLGSIAFSIYLFHMSLYLIIDHWGAFPVNSISELGVTLVMLPLFIFGCRYVERFGTAIYYRLKTPFRIIR